MGFFDKVTAGIDDRAERMKAIVPYTEKYPGICELFLGSVDAAGMVNRQPGAIRLFCNGGRIKCEINGQDWTRRGFFTFPEDEISIEFIEKNITLGMIEWVNQRPKKLGSTDAPY